MGALPNMEPGITTEDACANMMRANQRVEAGRSVAAAKMLKSLESLAGPGLPSCDVADPGAYAVLNHAFIRLRRAADDRDRDTAAESLAAWRDREPASERRPILLDADQCAVVRVQGVSDDAYCLRSPSQAESPSLSARLQASLPFIDAAGFRPVLDAATGVIVSLGTVPTGLSPVSFTMSFLPATSNVQIPKSAAELGEILVHEAAHSWLNECLGPIAAAMPSSPLLPSPWRGVARPPLAIVHSAFAFATVVRYLAAFPSAPEPDYDTDRMAVEQAILRNSRADIERSIEMVPDEEIRDLVHAQVRLAVER